MRIAVVTETYPPEINGVAITVARVVEGLLERGHRVHLVRPRQAEVSGRLAGEGFSETLTGGIPLPRYPELRLGMPASARLWREWRRDRPDVVHLATPGPLAWSALWIAGRLGIPVVSEFRTNFHAYSRYYGVGFLRRGILGALRRFHNRTAFTMVPTPGLAGELAGEGFRRVKVVARGVDAHRFSPVRRSESLRRGWGAGPGTLVVAGVGRLAMEKNLGLLAAAFERIRAARPDSRLVLVGEGPARGFIEGLCPGSVFAGKRFGEDLAAHYASADLLLFPSLTETFGNVTLEGMASGLGVVAFDYGAARLLVRSGENGWVAPYGDESAFIDAAVAAAMEGGALARVRLAAREEACRRSWERIVGEIEGIYREAVAPVSAAEAVPAGAGVVGAGKVEGSLELVPGVVDGGCPRSAG